MRFLLCVLILGFLASCTPSYPYLITSEGCNCETYVYRDEKRKIEIVVEATYEVSDRIVSTVELTLRNRSKDTLDMRQASIKGTSKNVRYQSNGRFQPMPYLAISPHKQYTMTFQGGDTHLGSDPWHKIAGEQVTLELKGLILGNKTLPSIVITLVPVNPKFPS